MQQLLGAGDPPPFSVHNEKGKAPLLLLCDHASNAVPKALGDLGLPASELARHIGWDIGGLDAALELSAALDAPLVASGYSRLVIDCNRWPGGEGSTPEISDGTPVPANRALAKEQIELRAEACFWPYHREVDRQLDHMMAGGRKVCLLVLHSFTPEMKGFKRPWHVGVLWNDDPCLPEPLLTELRRDPSLVVGDNEPYSARASYEYTLNVHARARSLPHCSLEVRQDLMSTPGEARRWGRRLAPAIAAAVAVALGQAYIPPKAQEVAMDDKTRTELEAAAFRRLVSHLRERTDVQNLDLMNLAGFCRNCLSRWYREEASSRGIEIPDPKAREIVYGMPYEEWKAKHQKEAPADKKKAFDKAQHKHG